MIYSLHEGAESDLLDSAGYYSGRAGKTLAQSFLAEFDHALKLLLRLPDIGSPTAGGNRRFSLRRFPYFIIYRVVESELRILAVAHQSRRPGYWRSRA